MATGVKRSWVAMRAARSFPILPEQHRNDWTPACKPAAGIQAGQQSKKRKMKRSVSIAACLILLCTIALSACAVQAPQKLANPCALPAQDDDWAVATPAEAGFDPIRLCKLLEETAAGTHNIHGLLIERQGRLVAEMYRRGKDTPITRLYGISNPFASATQFSADQLHDVRSISKSVVSLLYGVALEKGRAPALDSSVLQAYPGIAPSWANEGATMTFRHLLTMTSGLEWHEMGRGTLSSDETRLFWKSDRARFLLERPLVAKPGTQFNYNGGATTVLAETISRAASKTLAELAREDLLAPLGISHFEWGTDLHDRPLAFAGLRLRPRDLLKIGRLVNTRGEWHGRQIVPQSWIIESTRAHIPTGIQLLSIAGEEVHYGYQWWTGKVRVNGRDLTWVSGIGNGGQRAFAVPDLDMTLVLTAGDYGSGAIQAAESRLIYRLLETVKHWSGFSLSCGADAGRLGLD